MFSGHVAILHQRLQSICDILTLVPSSFPTVTHKDIVADELCKCGIFSSKPFQQCLQFGGSERKLRNHTILAKCRPVSMLRNCISRANDALRVFNIGTENCLRILRVVGAESTVLWTHGGGGGNKVVISERLDAARGQITDQQAEMWCQRMMKVLTGMIHSTKQLFNENVSAPPVAAVQRGAVQHVDTLSDPGLNFLRFPPSSSALSGFRSVEAVAGSSRGASLKRRRLENSVGDGNVFFSPSNCSAMAGHLLSDAEATVPWVNEAVASAKSDRSIKCKAFTQLHNKDILCTLLVYNCPDEPSSDSVLSISCDSNGFPLTVSSYKRAFSNVAGVGLEQQITSCPLSEDLSGSIELVCEVAKYRTEVGSANNESKADLLRVLISKGFSNENISL